MIWSSPNGMAINVFSYLLKDGHWRVGGELDWWLKFLWSKPKDLSWDPWKPHKSQAVQLRSCDLSAASQLWSHCTSTYRWEAETRGKTSIAYAAVAIKRDSVSNKVECRDQYVKLASDLEATCFGVWACTCTHTNTKTYM